MCSSDLRTEPEGKKFFELAFGLRPAEELYDLRKDPDQLRNVAADPAYASAKAKLSAQLMSTLTAAQDPRVTGDGQTFERSPFTDPVEPGGAGKAKKKQAATKGE